MASVTHAGATFSTAAGDKTVVATPTAGDLILIIAAATGVTGPVGALSVADDNADGNGVYTKVGASFTGFSTSAVGGLDAWVRNVLVGSATSTTFTATQTSSSGGGLSVFRISGMSIIGLGAVRGAGGQSSGAALGTPAPVLLGRVGSTFSGSQAALTGNVIIAAVANGTNSTTTVLPRSSPAYSEDFDNGYSTPPAGLETSHINSGETSATITFGGTTASTFASIAVELDASVPLFHAVVASSVDRRSVVAPLATPSRTATW